MPLSVCIRVPDNDKNIVAIRGAPPHVRRKNRERTVRYRLIRPQSGNGIKACTLVRDRYRIIRLCRSRLGLLHVRKKPLTLWGEKSRFMKRSVGPQTLLYPHPDLIVGTYDRDGRPNVMAAAWGGICCSRPPAVAVSLQKSRYTYANLMEQRAFTISIPSADYVREADFFGIASGKDVDKFAATGLTPVKSKLVNAPYVEEFPVVLECRLLRTVEIGVHTQFIGEILDVKVNESVLGEDGKPDVAKIRPFAYDSMRMEYYGFGEVLAKAFSAGREFRR